MSDGSVVFYDFNGVDWIKRQLGEQSIAYDSLTALHIKSLLGLNVNDQFIVDNNGNVSFAGHLEGASGTFSGNLSGNNITGATINGGVITQEDDSRLTTMNSDGLEVRSKSSSLGA